MIGDALLAGRFSVDHALQIGRIQANPRISQLLSYVVEVYVDRAEHRSFDEFRGDIDEFIRLTDQDGAFADLAEAVEGRNAQVSDVGGSLEVSVSGGDPVTTTQFIAVFESFVEGEYRKDVEARREMFGDDADQHPLPRTAAQRRYDAMIATLRKSESKMEPVLTALNDNVLYLKHNLNAKAVAALQVEFRAIEKDIEALIAEMRKAIASSNAFIDSMQ